MTTDKERRLVKMRKSLERESVKARYLAMDVTLAKEKLEDQDFMVDIIETMIRKVEAGEEGW